MTRIGSLSSRLVGRLTVGLSLLWLLAMAASALAVRDELDEVFDSSLQETAQRLLPLVAHEVGKRPGIGRDAGERRDGHGDSHDGDGHDDNGHDDDRTVARPDIELGEHEEYLIYQLRDADGRVLLRSHDAPRAPFPTVPAPGFGQAQGLRFYGERGPDGVVLQVAEPLEHRTETLREMLAWLAAPLLLLVPLAAGVIAWTVRSSLRPIDLLSRTIGTRGGGNLEPLPDLGLPRELQPIIHDVNRLLGRLSKALEGERAFAANSAHELRTPVAAALAQAQRLAAELRASPAEALDPAQSRRVAALIDSLRSLAALVEKLLQLARAEAGLGIDAPETDLMPVVRLLVEEFARSPAGAGRILLVPGGSTQLNARLDIDAFGIALRNLIDNALTHGGADEPVTVAIGEDRSVAVVNGGPAVPSEILKRVGNRFERAGASTPGSGLGLAIARTILEQAGATLTFASPAPGRRDGFEARIRLA